MAEDADRLEVSVRVDYVAMIGAYGDLLEKEHGAELAESFGYGEKFLLGGRVAALGVVQFSGKYAKSKFFGDT